MVTLDEFSRVVSEIYASSISPANWPVALNEISRILDATGCAIYLGRGISRSQMCGNVPADARDSYTEHFYAIDYVLDAVEKGPGGVIHGGQSLAALQPNSEVEADFMRPYLMDDGLFMRLSAGTTSATFLVVTPKGREPFDTAERVKFVGALVRHLEQALRTQDRLAELTTTAGQLDDVVDAIRHGIVIVGTSRRIVRLNSAAERILTSGDGLSIRSGSIAATLTATNEQLQGIITHALAEQGSGSRSGDSVACSRPSGKRPYVVHVVPLTSTLEESEVLVMIVDPENEQEPPKALIRRLFGLTNAEADVALRIMRGDGLAPISKDLAVSKATVRTHLQHIFDKTNTHRQAELLRLLLAISP
jgi:DNA-binding CsgD family transcriptional regulator